MASRALYRSTLISRTCWLSNKALISFNYSRHLPLKILETSLASDSEFAVDNNNLRRSV